MTRVFIILATLAVAHAVPTTLNLEAAGNRSQVNLNIADFGGVFFTAAQKAYFEGLRTCATEPLHPALIDECNNDAVESCTKSGASQKDCDDITSFAKMLDRKLSNIYCVQQVRQATVDSIWCFTGAAQNPSETN